MNKKNIVPLSITSPELSEEWDYEKNALLTPDDVSTGSNKKVWWICRNGHEWESVIQIRVAGNGCPYCSGRLAIRGENDLAK